MNRLDRLAWPVSSLPDAVGALARAGSLVGRSESPAPRGPAAGRMDRWIEATAASLGLEAEPVEAGYAEVPDLLRRAGPAVIRLEGPEERVIVLVSGAGRHVDLLGPDLRLVRLPASVLLEALRRPLVAPVLPMVEGVLDAVAVRGRRRRRSREAILRERLGAARIGGIWLLRPSPGSSARKMARSARLPGRLLALLGAQTAQHLMMLAAWWTIARGVLGGRSEGDWVHAGVLLFLTAIPFRLLATWLAGRVSIDVGSLLKERLLAGALLLETDVVRTEGAGQSLGRVIESSAVESLAINGGLQGLVAVVELSVAGGVLALGAGGAVHVALLSVCTVATVALAWQYHRSRLEWTTERLTLTHDLVERMMGHRTRLAQQVSSRWHDGEDWQLERYCESSRDFDRAAALSSVAPRGWLVLAVAGLAPSLASGATATVSLAVAVGGILLAARALRSLVVSLWSIAGATIAWRQVGPLFHAAARIEMPSARASTMSDPARREGDKVLQGYDLTFRYRAEAEPVLRKCSLELSRGERILLEGSSGSGKSTLASLLAGLRLPESGVVLLDGIDRSSLGSAQWRRRVAMVPQFHDNYVLTETFAFNLLMGRSWPPRSDDLVEAEAVCRDLGLGDLIDRMPGGLGQMVGETGWQLSHGERSRLYIARALLQRPDVLVLDESFAALDPETLRRAFGCVLARIPTLVVIAHP